MINKIKNKIYSLLFWEWRTGDFINKIYDLKIFYKYSFSGEKIKNKENYKAFLLKQYHILEKGLALPFPKENFGLAKIETLIKISQDYISIFGKDSLTDSIGEVLVSYLQHNTTLSEKNAHHYSLINAFLNQNKVNVEQFNKKGGVKQSNPIVLNNNFADFVKSRSSVRNFSDENVNIDDVKKAVDIAKYAPSVCNRQAWRTHYYVDKKKVLELLSCQDGNNGFTESINQLLIITVKADCFTKLESNQIFIDGGLYSMNLLLALHSRNIASCCLNLCVPSVKEKQIKKIASIPENERLIMMIGIGKYKENAVVAISNRRESTEILEIH
ncbi:MAG: nitroreductase family protein [Bergeyella sp.]